MKDVTPETVAVQAGGAIDEATGAIVPPIHLATTYLRDPDNQYRRGYCYGRPDNPTVRQVEEVLTRLEGGAASLVLASGMTAATIAMFALERPAHVVAPKVMYWGLRKWLQDEAPSLGIEATFVDADDPAAIGAAIRPGRTKLVWIETPANPLWTITDIAEAARLAHAAGALLGVDSTVPTPVLTRPLALGADVVMHSGTKYLGGHSDVVAGALVFARRDAYFERAARLRGSLGGILGPFEAALLLRGMRTLHVRVRHQCGAAMTIARHFARHPRIDGGALPGLETHPGHAVAHGRCRAASAACCRCASRAGRPRRSLRRPRWRSGSGPRRWAASKACSSIAPASKAPARRARRTCSGSPSGWKASTT